MDEQRAKKVIFKFVKTCYGKTMKREYDETMAWIAETEKFNPYHRTDDYKHDTSYMPKQRKNKNLIRDLGI